MKLQQYLPAVLLFLCATGARAQLKAVSYRDGDQELTGYAGAPTHNNNNNGHAGVLILPAWKGIDAHSRKVAEQLDAMGYHTFIADIYGEGHYPQSAQEAGRLSGYYKSHITEYQQRVRLALEQLVKSGAAPGKIVVIGYCFGGLGAIEAARINLPVQGIVSFHGSYGRDASRSIEPIKPRILILHGADDPNSSASDIQAMQDEFRRAKADWQMVYYGNAVHAFTDKDAGNDNSKGAAYNAAADKRSWEALKVFLEEVLR